MTRTRKLTLSMKEFGHLVSHSLDLTNAVPSSQPFVDNTAVFAQFSQKPHNRQSSFQRIFSRPTHARHDDSPKGVPEDHFEAPRKMVAWPFSRSPRKSHPAGDDDIGTDGTDPDIDHSTSPYSVTSLAAASTSSLGSLIPAHERLFQVASCDSPEQSHHPDLLTTAATSTPGPLAPSHASELPTVSGRDPSATALDEIRGNGSAFSVVASSDWSVVEPVSGTSNKSQTSFQGTEASHSANSESASSDGDPTPRAATFGPHVAVPPVDIRDNSVYAQRWHSHGLPLATPPRRVDVLVLHPAVGVAPYVPSETESLVSLCSTTSLASPIARASSPSFSTSPGTSPPRVSPSVSPSRPAVTNSPDTASPSNLEFVPTLGVSPRPRRPVMARSMTPPPLPRPPPTGPLPAVPSSIPPVPPLPPLPNRMSMNGTHPASSSPRSTIVGPPMNSSAALPPPPGGLRLPSRLSWVSSVRAVLPSPPASPTKSLKSLTCKTPPTSPSKTEKGRQHGLKRPTSIGVIEAADNIQVRRTKSILRLGSRSKSNTSLGLKRVQIHTEVHSDMVESRKPRRKSSEPTVSHPGPMITPTASSELLVPRIRRHSAPMLSSMDPKVSETSADWTLSLPFCTDVPGNKILPSPLPPLTSELKSEEDVKEGQGEDWTLCMPLKVRVDTPTIESPGGCDSASSLAKTPDETEVQIATQLPTPSPSPTWSTPVSAMRPLDPDPEEDTPADDDRPASPESLGPHVGGLDMDGGRGKRASGWHVYGWFDEVNVPRDERGVRPDSLLLKNHVTAFRKAWPDATTGRHPSRDSTSTSEATFYSARSSLVTN